MADRTDLSPEHFAIDVDDEEAVSRPAASAALLSRLLPAGAKPVPAVSATQPTLTWVLNSPRATSRWVAPDAPQVSLLGHKVTYDSTFGIWNVVDMTGAMIALDFVHTGQVVEPVLQFNNNATDLRVWIWVDGEPTTAAPIAPSGITPAGGNQALLKVDFGSSATRRITVYGSHVRSWGQLGMGVTDVISPAPRRPRIGLVGDSFLGGSNGTPQAFDLAPSVAAFLLGAEVVNAGLGGTGYTTTNNTSTSNAYGSALRIAQAAAGGTLDALVFFGSTNDGNAAGLQAAASACYAAYAAAFPGVPLVVIGQPPTTPVDTISTAKAAANAKLKAACDAAPNVAAFFDPVGTASGVVPASWANGVARNRGDRVTHLGAVWEWAASNGDNWGTPGTDGQWKMITWDYWGTGNSGSPAGSGSRDLVLYSDNIHPTTVGSRLLGRRIADSLRAGLAAHAAKLRA